MLNWAFLFFRAAIAAASGFPRVATGPVGVGKLLLSFAVAKVLIFLVIALLIGLLLARDDFHVPRAP